MLLRGNLKKQNKTKPQNNQMLQAATAHCRITCLFRKGKFGSGH